MFSGRSLQIALLLWGLSLLLFGFGIQNLSKPYFDETHYVPAAQVLITLEENSNWEHPPLAKFLIGSSIQVFGNRPLGWRIWSVFLGSLSIVFLYGIALLIFKNQNAAITCALLSLFNHFLFVQSRIATLEIFQATGMLAAIFFFLLYFKKTEKSFLFLSGVSWGLALSSKWFSAVPWVVLSGVFLISFLQGRKNWKEIPPRLWIQAMILTPLGIYLLSYLPLFFLKNDPLTLSGLLELPFKIFKMQVSISEPHPYHSPWYEWPLMLKPIWYAFEETPSEKIRGVFLVGNPLIVWGGLGALVLTTLDGFRRKKKQALWIVATYFVLFLSWALIPRSVAFFYYYFPAAIVLSFALTYVFEEMRIKSGRWFFILLCGLLFFYFYPILAGLEIEPDSFTRWTWFPSWV